MRIIVHNFSKNNRSLLLNSIDELKRIIRVNYRAEINIIDSVDNIFYWASSTALDMPEGKKTIIVAPKRIIDALNNTLISRSLLYVEMEKKTEDVVIEIAKFLSCKHVDQRDVCRETILFSEKEAETIYEVYTQGAKLIKNKQNIKYRVMRKLNIQSHFQLFVWWGLTDILPKSQLKNRIMIK